MDYVRVSLIAIALFAARAGAKTLKVGDKVPNFGLTASDGKTYVLNQQKTPIVVLEWYNTLCPFVRKFYDAHRMQEWQAQQTGGPEPVTWLTIASSASGKQGFLTARAAAKQRDEVGMKSTALLLDAHGKVGRLFGAKTTPHVFVINKGRLAYVGAVDDRPSAQPATLDGAENYLLEALEALKNDRPIKTPSTAPYGCAVKY